MFPGHITLKAYVCACMHMCVTLCGFADYGTRAIISINYLCVAVSNVSGVSTLAGAIAAAGCVSALLLLGALITWCYCRQRQRKKSDTHNTMDIINDNIYILRYD